jgi:hypothetical protein
LDLKEENNILLSEISVLTAASMKMAVFCVVAPCSLAETDRQLLAMIAPMTEAVSTSETSVNSYQTTRCNIPNPTIFILVAVRT